MTLMPNPATFTRRGLAAILALCFVPQMSLADGLESPAGDVILEILVQDASTNADDKAGFCLGMLDALPPRETVPATP